MDTHDKNQTFQIVAMILLVLGAALLAYSAYEYVSNEAGTTQGIAASSDDSFLGVDEAVTIPLVAGLVSLGIGSALLFMRSDTMKPRPYAGAPRNAP